ncbi:MAG TPA: DUF192 domain-containing protein [Alphaproteobacteria bacterium]|nr:DUF192 domain-containing protein [Alphaproteobacteria bacterium]
MKTLLLGLMLLANGAFAATALRTTSVTLIGPHGEREVIKAEVADTPKLREVGLMNRKQLGADEGMVFVWPQAEKVGFWMKDTLISLDIIFARGGQVVAVAPDAKPMDETVISPPDAIDLVLEVNGGWAARHKMGAGWRVAVGQ